MESETGSVRKNEGKLRLDLVPISAINAMAKVLTKGAEKYEERNWEKGNKYSVAYASLLRHLTAWWDGEDLDQESGESHLSHALMNMAMLVEYSEKFPQMDDRPNTKSPQKRILNRNEDDVIESFREWSVYE